jgi:hypothetical protein
MRKRLSKCNSSLGVIKTLNAQATDRQITGPNRLQFFDTISLSGFIKRCKGISG